MTDDVGRTETFEQGDDAVDEASRLDPDFQESLELDPSLDPHSQVDERELEEAGAVLDDPEELVLLDGMMDDPDGLTPWPAKPTPKGGTSTLRSHGIWKTTMIEGTEYQI